jgi:Skp family chaperone for outer membrane proteins
MIVPAAGTVLLIIEGLQAAWGTVSRILQAFERFMAFLKAVKTGQAGPPFGAALAAAGVVVIDFVSNWLLKRLRGPASKVAGKIKEIAKKIGNKLKKAVKKLGKKFGKLKDKLFGKKDRKGGKNNKEKHDHGNNKEDKAKKNQEKLDQAVRELQPKINTLLHRGVSGIRLRAQLAFWRVRYGLKSLQIEPDGSNRVKVFATVNPTKDVVRNIVQAEGDKLLKMIREAAISLRSDPLVKAHHEHQKEQRQLGAGETEDNPLIIGNAHGHLGAAESVANQERPPWTREHIALGQHTQGEMVVKEQQTYSSRPGHIHVVGGGKYENLIPELNAIKSATGTTDTEIVEALQTAVRTGRIPSVFTKNPEHEAKFKALTRLMFNVEPGRGLAETIMGPIRMDMLRQGSITPQEAFVDLNQMAPVGAVKRAHGADESLGFPRQGTYKQKATASEIQGHKNTEMETIIAWLYTKMNTAKPCFTSEQELRNFIKNELKERLQSEAGQFLGL